MAAQDSPDFVKISSEQTRNITQTASHIDESVTVSIIGDDSPEHLSRMIDSQQAIKGKLINTFDASKLNDAFDIMFGLITAQQKEINKVIKAISLIEAKQDDYDHLFATVNEKEQKQDTVNADMLSALSKMMTQVEKLNKINDSNPGHLDQKSADVDKEISNMKKPQNLAENIDVEPNSNIEVAESSLSQQIEDSSSSNVANNVTNTDRVPHEILGESDLRTSELDIAKTDKKIHMNPADGHHVASAETPSNIILNSDKEKTSLDQDRISNLTGHNGQKSNDSQIDGLKQGYDNKNNDDMGSTTPKDSAAISIAAIQLEIGNMKETEKANTLYLMDKIRCDNELLNLLKNRVNDQENISKEFEFDLEKQKKELNDMQKALNLMNKTQQAQAGIKNATVTAVRDTAKSISSLTQTLTPALVLAVPELPVSEEEAEADAVSMKSLGTAIVPSASVHTMSATATAAAILTIMPTTSSILPTNESITQDNMSISSKTAGTAEREANQYLTLQKEINDLKALLHILDVNGGIERVFNAVDDLGFQQSGGWDEDATIDSRSILHRIVKKICDDILKDVEEVAVMASDAAAAADSSATVANESAEIATAAALSVTNALLSFNIQAAVIAPSSSSSPSFSPSFSSSLLDSTIIAQKETEEKNIEKVVEIPDFDDEISLSPTPKQNIEISNIHTDIINSLAIQKEENIIKNLENILLNENFDVRKEKNAKIDVNSDIDLKVTPSSSAVIDRKEITKSEEKSTPITLDPGSESGIHAPKGDGTISKILVTPSAVLSSKNHRTSGRDQNPEKEGGKNKDGRPPLQVIRDQRNLEEQKLNDKKDFLDLKKEVISLKAQMITKNEINSMLTSTNSETFISPLSEQLRDFIVNTVSKSTILPISFTTEIMKLKNEINLQLKSIEKHDLFMKTNVKNELNGNGNINSSQKDRNAFAWKPEVARITDSVKKLTTDQEESLNQV